MCHAAQRSVQPQPNLGNLSYSLLRPGLLAEVRGACERARHRRCLDRTVRAQRGPLPNLRACTAPHNWIFDKIGAMTTPNFDELETQIRAEADKKVAAARALADAQRTLLDARADFEKTDAANRARFDDALAAARTAGFDDKTLAGLKLTVPDGRNPTKRAPRRRAPRRNVAAPATARPSDTAATTAVAS